MVVVQREERRAITAYRWGLIPHWATDAKVASRMFNARAETLTASPAFREAFRRTTLPRAGRLVLRVEARGHDPPAVPGRPRRWPAARAGRPVGRLAAIRRPRRSGGRSRSSPPPRTTRSRDLHDRMPVVIPEGAWDRWLGPTPDGSRRAAGAPRSRTTTWSSTIYPVVRDVNDVRRDGPGLIEPLVAVGGSSTTGSAAERSASVRDTGVQARGLGDRRRGTRRGRVDASVERAPRRPPTRAPKRPIRIGQPASPGPSPRPGGRPGPMRPSGTTATIERRLVPRRRPRRPPGPGRGRRSAATSTPTSVR